MIFLFIYPTLWVAEDYLLNCNSINFTLSTNFNSALSVRQSTLKIKLQILTSISIQYRKQYQKQVQNAALQCTHRQWERKAPKPDRTAVSMSCPEISQGNKGRQQITSCCFSCPLWDFISPLMYISLCIFLLKWTSLEHSLQSAREGCCTQHQQKSPLSQGKPQY